MLTGHFHFHTEPLSRSAGRNAVASAAYASATVLRCERTGNLYDYGRAHRVAHSEIMTHADAPAWARDRATLWNAAEAREKRSDSRVGRSFEAAIPNGLTRDQQLELVRGFIQAELVGPHGVAADFSIHDEDPAPGRTRNPHFHATTSHRAILADGFSTKVCDVLNKEAELMRLREAWADHSNRMLERAQIKVRVDHRSYAAQGRDQIPQIHEGYAARAIEAAGGVSDRCQQNREIAALNRRLTQLRNRRRRLAAWWKEAKERFGRAMAGKSMQATTRDQAPRLPAPSQQPKAAAGPRPLAKAPAAKEGSLPQPPVPAPLPAVASTPPQTSQPGYTDEQLLDWQLQQWERGR